MASIDQATSKSDSGVKPMNVFKRKLRKYLNIALIFVILIIAGYIYWSYFFTFSDGYRAGLLQKFSRKGTVFKTYEGEMILSSVQSNKNVPLASEKFIFSVSDKAVALQLDTIQGKNIVVHYTQKNRTLPWRGESPYIVSSAKVSD
jgi:hypothetical protein